MRKISILIPCYNEKKLIEKSILQAINLKSIKKEIIIIDNGSSDGTQKIIQKYSKKKNLKIVLRKKNLGYGCSVKQGLKMSLFKYMYIHFSDCEYDINSCIKMYDLAEKKNLDAVFGSRLKGLSSKILFKYFKNKPAYLGTFVFTFLYNFLYSKNFTDVIGSKMYKVKSLKNIKIKHNHFRFDFALKSMLMNKKFKVEEVFVNYKKRISNADKNVKFYHMFPGVYEIFKNKIFDN
tara:strand:- start:401 stop:1105 length:705 start_codon:yes stop_codon:yes gene_type:complete